MAIVIEEEKNNNKANPWTIATWGLVLIVVLVAVYYVFRSPELIETSIPPHLQTTKQISEEIQLNPETIVNSKKFSGRKSYVTPPIPGNLGRINPFVPL